MSAQPIAPVAPRTAIPAAVLTRGGWGSAVRGGRIAFRPRLGSAEGRRLRDGMPGEVCRHWPHPASDTARPLRRRMLIRVRGVSRRVPSNRAAVRPRLRSLLGLLAGSGVARRRHGSESGFRRLRLTSHGRPFGFCCLVRCVLRSRGGAFVPVGRCAASRRVVRRVLLS